MTCPSFTELLELVIAGEQHPHVGSCPECSAVVEILENTARAFDGDRAAFDRALSSEVDRVLAGSPSRRWAAQLAAERRFHHAVVVADILRRADRQYENASIVSDLTSAAVALCDAMVQNGTPPPAQLFFDALKEHAMALRACGDLNGSLEALARARAMTAEEENREHFHAVISLCTALTYSEADLGKFDEAISLAETAEAVLERCGDRRRALMARQTKAYALMAMGRHSDALSIVVPVAEEYDAMGSRFDAATAHHLAAHCYAEAAVYDEALHHALVAQCVYESTANSVLVARATHVTARAIAGMGRFAEASTLFEQSAEVLFGAGLYDVWVLDRLDYIAAALHDDVTADVRADVESVARVCLMLGGESSTMRRRYAAEAMNYLRRLAKRDALTTEVAEYVREYMVSNASRPPVRFTAPPCGEFLM